MDCKGGGGGRMEKTDFCDSSSEVTSNEKFIPLKFSLNDDESKVGLWIHISRHLLNFFNLRLDTRVDAFKQTISRPPDTPDK